MDFRTLPFAVHLRQAVGGGRCRGHHGAVSMIEKRAPFISFSGPDPDPPPLPHPPQSSNCIAFAVIVVGFPIPYRPLVFALVSGLYNYVIYFNCVKSTTIDSDYAGKLQQFLCPMDSLTRNL